MSEAFASADFGRAAEIFDTAAPAKAPFHAVLWRGRILLKKHARAALHFLEEHEAPTADRAGRAEREMLLGIAFGRLGMHAEAAQHFESAERHTAAAHLDELRAETAYWRARDAVMQGKLDRAKTELRAVESTGSLQARVRALDLQSLIEGRRRNYARQAALLIELLQLLNGSDDMPEFRVWAVHTLAGLAREIYLPQARHYVVQNLSRAWPPGFEENRFQAEKAVGWQCALEGDYFNAFRYLKAAAQTAPQPAWKTMALLDRAYLAKAMGESLWSRQELAEAEDLAETIEWEQQTGEERIALLLFAELYAPIDRGKAVYYLEKFRSLPPLSDPLLNWSYDDRLQAFADYTAGIVEIALSHRKHGLRLLRNSFDIFDAHGYAWRAARAALRIHQYTGDSAMLTAAREKLRNYTSSWLWPELVKQTQAGETTLSPMQQAVFREICQGRSTRDIASSMRISEFTVRNHLRLVFKAFGVNSRTALIAEASRRGLLD